MMSISQIRHLSNEQAAKAAKSKKRPYVPFSRTEVENYPPFTFPNIGSYTPKGWKERERLFVDKTGFGSEHETALTVNQFKEKLLKLYDEDSSLGYAIIEEGQFQVYIGVFEEYKKRKK